MKKKVLSIVLTIGLATAVNSFTMADPLSDQLKNQQNQLQQNKSALNEATKKREEMNSAVEKLDSQIEGLMRDSDKIKVQINKTQSDIKVAEKDVQKAQADIKDEQQLFNKRMRAMYVNGMGGYIEVILEADGLSDMVSKIESVKKIIEFDKKIIANLNGKKVELQKKKDALDTQNKKLLTLKADNDQKIVKMNQSKAEQVRLLQDISKQEKLYAAKTKESQQQVNATLKQIKAISSSVQKYNPSRGAADLSSNAVVAYASNFLGTRYVWGGNYPNPGFDCSGYTKYVYAHFGVNIGRTTYDQINDGSPVSRDQLQPGDLVFFGTASNPHHVGIYVGNNCYIHAPQTGDVVKVSAMDRGDYVTGRRIR